MKAFFNFLHTFQPLQGLFANVISPDNKDHFGFAIPLCGYGIMPQRYEKRDQNQENQRLNGLVANDLAIHKLTLRLLNGHIHRMNSLGSIGKSTTSKEASSQCLCPLHFSRSIESSDFKSVPALFFGLPLITP